MRRGRTGKGVKLRAERGKEWKIKQLRNAYDAVSITESKEDLYHAADEYESNK